MSAVPVKRRDDILEDTDISWVHQVAVMFQIVSALALEVPAFLQNIENLTGCVSWCASIL